VPARQGRLSGKGDGTVQIDRYDNGVPSWVDMGSPDLEKSRAFYSALFGWNCPEGPAEAGGYSVCDLGGKTVAGLGPQMMPDVPPNWMTYVDVDSVDDTVAKVSANGGNVLAPPMDVMDAGRMAVVADPLGAVIGLWQPNQHTGAQLANEPGAFCWNELVTTDLDASKSFYKAVFGWEANEMGPPGDAAHAYIEWKLGDRSVGGMMPKTPEMPADMPPMWGVYFAVADCDASAAKAQEVGGSLFMGPTDIEPGRFAVLADNVGAVFNILQLKS
jgi:predicted enzyme related to lactoylglutathione lyase